MQRQHVPAMTVAAALSDRIVYSSAAAAMTLVDTGKLDLDAPVQKYCPSFPLKQWPVTTRELLSHTAGIRHYKDGEIENTRHYMLMSDGFVIFANDPLLFEPGTAYSYSTTPSWAA